MQEKRKILIVDDKPEIRNLLNMFLSRDYNITTAENGMQAFIQMRNEGAPNCIISDIQMPDLDGVQFLEMLKSSGVYKDIPVIILSSLSNSEDRIKLLDMGATDYLTKPFNPQELKIKIDKILQS
ncbi:MAG: PleD family two-component system response regulator [Marinifilaceae bacterium]|jgi:DNA-binding response OmpR family regulator